MGPPVTGPFLSSTRNDMLSSSYFSPRSSQGRHCSRSGQLDLNKSQLQYFHEAATPRNLPSRTLEPNDLDLTQTIGTTAYETKLNAEQCTTEGVTEAFEQHYYSMIYDTPCRSLTDLQHFRKKHIWEAYVVDGMVCLHACVPVHALLRTLCSRIDTELFLSVPLCHENSALYLMVLLVVRSNCRGCAYPCKPPAACK